VLTEDGRPPAPGLPLTGGWPPDARTGAVSIGALIVALVGGLSVAREMLARRRR
jgi:hypothetical protein